jgi:tRNA(Ile)-lysidine synthase
MQALPRSLSQLRAAERIVQEDLAASFGQCAQLTPDGFVLTIGALLRFSEPLFRLGEWLRPYGFTPDVLAQCWHAVGPSRAEGRNGQVFLAPAHWLVHDRGQLWLLPRHAAAPLTLQLPDWPTTPLELGSDGQLLIKRISRTAWDGQWPAEQNTALLDAEALPFPWTLRTWREGDRFSPLGMNGSRLISDFLAEAKLPIHQRERVLVLESGNRIVWVVGLRVAQSARITHKTNEIALLSWQRSS